jgi:hypothetical protein
MRTMSPLTLELLLWISRRPRTYPEAIEVWRTNCPRHSIWEDALGDGLIQVRRSEVSLTALGRRALGAHRREEAPGRAPEAQTGVLQHAEA